MVDELKKSISKKKGFRVKVDAYLESSRTSVMELFCENS